MDGRMYIIERKTVAAALYNNAIDMISGSELSKAVILLEQAHELDAECPLFLNALGLCHFIKGNFNKAAACWYAAGSQQDNSGYISQQDGNNSSNIYLGYLESDDFLKYKNRYNKCISFIGNRKYLKALAILLPVLGIIKNVDGYNLAGLLCYETGFRKTAAEMWKKALKLDISDNHTSRYISGCSLGFLPAFLEKILLEVLLHAGRFKLL